MKNAFITQNRNILYIALATAAILSVPLIAMQFTSEVVWTLGDFIIAGVLLFGAGLTFELLTRKLQDKKHKVIIGLAVLGVLLYVWAELAVGVFTNLGS